MQTIEVRDRHDTPTGWRLDFSGRGAIAPERLMGADGVEVEEVAAEQASGVPFVEHDEVIEAVPADGADQALGEGFCQGPAGR